MLKAMNISLFKMMTAGYLSAEAYSVLKSKTHLSDLSMDDLPLLPCNIAMEIKRLCEDKVIKKSILELAQMEEWISNDDKRLYELLDLLLSSSTDKIKQFLSSTESRYFLLNYVFSDKDNLSTQAFTSHDNIEDVSSFIIKCEDAFAHLFATGEIEPNLISKKPMSYSDYTNTTKATDNSVVEEAAETYSVRERTPRMTLYPVDKDAVSPENKHLRKYVIILSQLTEDEFKPFKRFVESQLYNTPGRTNNVIKLVGIHEFCVNYLFAADGKLMSIQNFGKKSLYDFGLVRQTIIDYIVNILDRHGSGIEEIDDIVTSMSEEVENEQIQLALSLKEKLGDTLYSILGKMLCDLIQNISGRSRNAVTNYKGDFIEDFVHKNKSVIALKNVGRKSSEEIEEVIKKLKEYVDKALKGELSPEKLQVMELQMLYGYCLDEFVLQYFSSHGHVPMFHILENWIKGQKGKEWSIFNSYCSIFADNEKKTLDELAEENKLSRERCRQLYNEAKNQLQTIHSDELAASSINYSKIISDKNEWSYIYETISDINLLDLSSVESYIAEEKCDLTKEFCFFIVSIVFKNEFSVVGRELMSPSTRAEQKWTNTYLVKREYTEAFCFNELPKLIEETEKRLTNDIEVDAEQLAINTFFMAWNDFDTDKVWEVSDILSQILIQEFGKIPNENFQFTLEGKKTVNATDVIYDILHANGDPMNVDDIFEQLDKILPNRYKSSASIKTLIASDPRICMVGTANLVGLLEWQHVKVGSIRDIIVQYLSKFNEPVQVADIIEHVQQYRDSSENSIRSTMCSGGQFVRFSGGLYGLKDKTYASWYALPEKRHSFALRVNDLEVFLRDNLHFPFCRSSDSREKSLYNWWRRTQASDDLSDEQKEEVRRIVDQYKDYPTTLRDNEWNELYKSYKAFLLNHGRKPLRSNQHERPLYSWFEKCSKDFMDGNLTSAREKMYIELCDLL